jgi:hypothetical protein
MFTRLLLASFLVLLANGGITFASAQTPADAQSTVAASEPNAVALASRALQSLAGGTALNDITLQGTVSYTAGSDSQSGMVLLEARGNGQSRVVLNLGDGQRQEVRNRVAGYWSGPDGSQYPMAAHNCWTDAPWFFPGLSLQGLAGDPQVSIFYLGPETRDGVTLHHLRLLRTLPGQTSAIAAEIQRESASDLYLDGATLLPLVLTFNTHPDDAHDIDIPVEIQFADYRLVNGVRVPFRIRKFLQGSLLLDIVLSGAAINTGLQEGQFAIQTSAGGES